MTYKCLGDYIREVNIRNRELKVTKLVGLTIDKAFIPSVANVIGTDLSNYKVIRREQFACSLMQVSRDGKMPVAMYEEDEAIMSPAYPMFEVIDKTALLPQYLMMWFSRSEFDREASYYAVGGVRGSLTWEDFCNMQLPVPSIERQREIVSEYETLTNRIHLNEQMIQHLEATAQALYCKMFVEGIDKENLPEGWRVGVLGEVAEKITRGKSPKYEDSHKLVIGQRCVRNHMVDLNLARPHLPKAGTINLKFGDVLINSTGDGSLGRVGQVYFDRDDISFDSHVTLVRFHNEADSFYYGSLLCMSEKDIESLAVGSTGQTELPRDSVLGYSVMIPDRNVIENYYQFVKPIKNTESLLLCENYKLKELQSLLLAKMGNLKQ